MFVVEAVEGGYGRFPPCTVFVLVYKSLKLKSFNHECICFILVNISELDLGLLVEATVRASQQQSS